MRPLATLAVLVLAVPPALPGQAVVDPGMSKAQVIAKLGAPAVQRSTGNATYLYYRNGAERRVGMSDIVVLESDKVVDAVFRSSARKYSGKSSSPSAIPAEVARRHPQDASGVSGNLSVPAATRAPAVKVAPAGAAAKAAARESAKMPAQRANEAKAVTPTPQARSAMLEQQKAATKTTDSSKAAKAPASKGDSAKAPKKP